MIYDIQYLIPLKTKNLPHQKKTKTSPKKHRWVRSGQVVLLWKKNSTGKPLGGADVTLGRWCPSRGVAPSFLVDQQGLTFREGWTWQFAHRRPGDLMKGVEVMDGLSIRNGFILKIGQIIEKKKRYTELGNPSFRVPVVKTLGDVNRSCVFVFKR